MYVYYYMILYYVQMSYIMNMYVHVHDVAHLILYYVHNVQMSYIICTWFVRTCTVNCFALVCDCAN